MIQSRGRLDAPIMVILDGPSQQDLAKGVLASGGTGTELNALLSAAGIDPGRVFLTCASRRTNYLDNLIDFTHKKAPKDKPDWYWSERLHAFRCPSLDQDLAFLDREIATLKPKLILALGELAFRALGHAGHRKWRGSELSYGSSHLVPTLPPSALFAQYDLRPWVVTDLGRAKRLVDGAPKLLPDYKFIIRPQLHQVERCLIDLNKRLYDGPLALSVDIETRAGYMTCLGIAWSKTEAICIPYMVANLDEPNYWSEPEERAINELVRIVLTHPNARVVGQNFAYDAQYLWKELRCIPALAADTMLMQHVIFPGTPKALDHLASIYCDTYRYWKDDGKNWSVSQFGEDQLWSYNCEDAVRTLEIAEKQLNLIDKEGLLAQFEEIHRTWYNAVQTMIGGMRADPAARTRMRELLRRERAKREAELIQLLGHPVNVSSSPLLQKLFYEDFRQPTIYKKRGKGVVSATTDDSALITIARREPILGPVCSKIREIRSIRVFDQTFVSANISPDGRYRSYYNVAGAETYRLSSSTDAFGDGLNLQNIPSGGDSSNEDLLSDLTLPNIRELFLPEEATLEGGEWEICDMDLSSADLRVVVAEAQERGMQQWLDDGASPYVEIAKEYYGDPSFSKKHPRYRDFKSFAHGTNYLGTPEGLSDRIGLSLREAREVQAWYLGKFPGIRKWQEKVKASVRSTRRVTNCFGYRRIYFDRIEGTIFNQAVAWIGQSTTGIQINRIWEAVRSRAPWIKVLLQVHDSLVFCYPVRRREEALAIINGCSNLRLPGYDWHPIYIPVGVKTSTISWGHCE